MTSKLLFDTDILIDFLRGYEAAKEFLLIEKKNSFLLSSITVAELFAGVRNDNEEHAIDFLLSSFNIVEVNNEIARNGGLLKQKYNKINGIGLADAIIAATAIYCEASLVTLNKKHYPSEIDVITPYMKNILQ